MKSQHGTTAFTLRVATVLLLVFVGTTLLAGPVSAANTLSRTTAQRLLDELKNECKEGAQGDKSSRCYKVGTSLKNNLKCGDLYQYWVDDSAGKDKKGKVQQQFPDRIAACQKKVSAIKLTSKEKKAQEQAKKKAAKEKESENKAEAKEACKDKPDTQRSSCEKGYLGSLQGKLAKNVCKGLTGTKATACKDAFAEAEGAGGNDVTDGPGDVPVSDIDLDSLPDSDADKDKLDTMANIAFGIAGSLAMLFVVVGGVRYIMSQGDPQKVAQSRNTIMYATAGLVVTISAFAIIRFVLQRIV